MLLENRKKIIDQIIKTLAYISLVNVSEIFNRNVQNTTYVQLRNLLTSS